MSEQERFLNRWSRLKQQPVKQPLAESDAVSPETPPCTDPATDLSTLPPLDTLGADSDYTPFLNVGVPEELRCMALRKAWASDPAIAGFRGFAEYDWDCNAPGYGQLLPIDDIQRLCDAVFGDEPAPPPPPRIEDTPIVVAETEEESSAVEQQPSRSVETKQGYRDEL